MKKTGQIQKLAFTFMLAILTSSLVHAQQKCADLFLPAPQPTAVPSIPTEYAEDIQLSQAYNIPFRRGDILPEETRVPVPLYHFDLPRAQAKWVIAHLDAETEKLAFITKDGKPFLRFFIVNDEHARFANIKSFLDGWHIPLEQKFWAVRLQSQFTFFCWDPNALSESPFYLKVQKTYKGGVVRNKPIVAEVGVRTDMMVENILRDDPSDFITVLPERLATSFNINGIEFANSFRSVKPLNEQGKNSKLWTANGFFGSAKIRETAARLGLTEEQWIQIEFLPKFARFMAEMSYRYGIVPEAHTQNVMMNIDENSGQISGFVLKDLADILYDPFSLILLGKSTHSEPIRGVGKVARMNHIPVESDSTKSPGGMMTSYVMQSVMRLTEDGKKQREYAIIFLKNYIRAVEQATGQRVTLSSWSQLRYDEFLSDAVLKPWWEVPADYKPTYLPYNFVSAIVNGIYDSVTRARLPVVQPAMESYDQGILKKIAMQAHARFEVAIPALNGLDFFTDATKSNGLKYAFDGKGIIIFSPLERKSKKIVGYAFGLFPDEISEILASKIP